MNLRFSHKSCINNYYSIFQQIVPILVLAKACMLSFEKLFSDGANETKRFNFVTIDDIKKCWTQ
jgi:hypothetical protein